MRARNQLNVISLVPFTQFDYRMCVYFDVFMLTMTNVFFFFQLTLAVLRSLSD